MMQNASKVARHDIEQSAYYIGYRLFWILGLFLRGMKFPSGTLEPN